MDTDDMIKIVDTVYEEHGDPSWLKCSYLAEYANTQGFDVKAYDFRRNPAVRERIDELSDLSPFFSEGKALVYKGLDADAFLRRNKTPAALKNALIELDTTWRKVYERACSVLNEREKLTSELDKKTADYEQLAREYHALEAQSAELRSNQKEMLLKNRYLTGTVKEYLYPAIANEILKNEGTLVFIDTEVTPHVMDALSETDMPDSFSKSITTDRQMFLQADGSYNDEPPAQETREKSLLRLMAANIGGKGDA